MHYNHLNVGTSAGQLLYYVRQLWWWIFNWFSQHIFENNQVIGDSIVTGLRPYPSVLRTFFKQYRTINLGIGGDRTENVLWCAKDIILPRSVMSVIIQCSKNNIAINKLREIILCNAAVVEFISKHHTSIKVMVTGILPRDIHRSTRRAKIKKISAFFKYNCDESSEITFMSQRKDLILPDNSIYKITYKITCLYKDHLHLIENGNIKL